MKPLTPGFWLIVATVGLLALLPMRAVAGMTPEEVELFERYKVKAEKGDPVAQYTLGNCYDRGWGVASRNMGSEYGVRPYLWSAEPKEA